MHFPRVQCSVMLDTVLDVDDVSVDGVNTGGMTSMDGVSHIHLRLMSHVSGRSGKVWRQPVFIFVLSSLLAEATNHKSEIPQISPSLSILVVHFGHWRWREWR